MNPEDLAQAIERGRRLTLDEALELVVEICERVERDYAAVGQ